MIQSLRKSVGYLIWLVVVGQFVSFLRESTFAFFYGTSYQADAYVMASQIPVTLFAVVTTSINTVILPVYSLKKEENGIDMADKFLNSFIFVFELLCLALSFLALLFARQITLVFAPAFSGELLELTIRYVRLLFPTILFSALINILTVRYNVQKNFSYPQFVSLIQNIAIIGMMVVFARSVNTDAAVYGTILGLALNAIFLAIPCRKIFFKRLELKGLWQDIRKVLSKVLPIACGVGIAEINRIVDKAIASGLDTGSITGLNYANKLTVVFSALIVTALSPVCFQQFSTLQAQGLFKERFKVLQKYILVLVYILLPITCGVLIFRKELITVAFARGAFGTESASLTSNIFFYYAIGILPIAIREILSKYFYSAGDTKMPMINSAIGVVINIVLNLVLSKFMGVSGLAFATSISYFIICLLLIISIMKREKGVGNFTNIMDYMPAVLASIVMCIIVFASNIIVNSPNALLRLVAGMFVGMISYSTVCFIFARRQLRIIVSVLFGRI